LTELETLINKMNQYLNRRLTECRELIPELDTNQDEDKQKESTKRLQLVLELERTYKNTVTRMLEDLFHITTEIIQSEKDKSLFHKKIVELKSRLAYHDWSVDLEKKFFDLQIANMKNYMRIAESQRGTKNYIKGEKIKSYFIEPLITRINNFKQIL